MVPLFNGVALTASGQSLRDFAGRESRGRNDNNRVRADRSTLLEVGLDHSSNRFLSL